MKKLMLLLLAATLISGCAKTATEKAEVLENAKKIDATFEPELVTTLSDGRPVHRLRITAVPSPDCESCGLDNPHWVYFVGQDATVNQQVKRGKVTHNEAQIVLDGKPMTVFEAQTAVERRIATVEKEERELLLKLQAKYRDAQ